MRARGAAPLRLRWRALLSWRDGARTQSTISVVVAPGVKTLATPIFSSSGMSPSGMIPPPKTTMSLASRCLSRSIDLGEQRHVGAGEHREAHGVGVLLDRRLDDLLRGLVQAGVDDLHAGVAQGAGDDLGAAVVAVESGLGHDDAHGELSHGRRLATPARLPGSGGESTTWAGPGATRPDCDLMPSYVRLEPATFGRAMPQSIRRLRTAGSRTGAALAGGGADAPDRDPPAPAGDRVRRLQGQPAASAANDIVGGAARALATPTGLVGAAVEAAWLTTHLALYPWGLVGRHGADSQLGVPRRAPAPDAARSGHLRRRGGRDADPAGARHGRQPLDLHPAAPGAAPPRLRPGDER